MPPAPRAGSTGAAACPKSAGHGVRPRVQGLPQGPPHGLPGATPWGYLPNPPAHHLGLLASRSVAVSDVAGFLTSRCKTSMLRRISEMTAVTGPGYPSAAVTLAARRDWVARFSFPVRSPAHRSWQIVADRGAFHHSPPTTHHPPPSGGRRDAALPRLRGSAGGRRVRLPCHAQVVT